MESNICSVLGKISGVTEGISQIRGMSIISENGQIDKNKVMQLMLKNPADLTKEEKEMLAYVEKVLGEDKYIELMNLAGMNTSASVAYIVDPKTGEAIDLSHIDKNTLQRINYLMDKLNSLGVDDV